MHIGRLHKLTTISRIIYKNSLIHTINRHDLWEEDEPYHGHLDAGFEIELRDEKGVIAKLGGELGV